jgi:hypothetical protein
MTIEATRDLATRLIVSTGALAAFGLALEERATGLQLDPAIKAEVDHCAGQELHLLVPPKLPSPAPLLIR